MVITTNAVSNPFIDAVNQAALNTSLANLGIQGVQSVNTYEVKFTLLKVSNGHVLEVQPYQGQKIVRIIPEGDNIGDHVTAALVEAKLEK